MHVCVWTIAAVGGAFIFFLLGAAAGVSVSEWVL